MDPTTGQFPRMTPGQLGYPELTPTQLADPRTPVTVSGITLELWQVGHIYGVSYDPPVDAGKWKEKAAGDHSLGSTSSHGDERTGHQSSSGLRTSRGRHLSTASSGTSGSFYSRPSRREGIIGPPPGGGSALLPRIRSRSQERPEITTTETQPKYSLFPRVGPSQTTAAPDSTPTDSQLPNMSGSGSGSQGSQPEMKSVWERSPSPPDWKKTVKGAVSKGLRQVGSSLALRSKRSNVGLKETPQTHGAEGQKMPSTADKIKTPNVPPVPPITWRTTPGSSNAPRADSARPVTTRFGEASTGPSPSPSGPSGSMQSTRDPGEQFISRQMTTRPIGPLRPPPEGRFRYMAERALATGVTVQPFDTEENIDGAAAAPPPPVPPRSVRRPPPAAGPSIPQNQYAASSQHRLIQPSGRPLASATATMPTPAPFTCPRPAPPPPLPPHIRPTEQERGRSRSITNIFRRARQGEDNRESEGSQTSKNAK